MIDQEALARDGWVTGPLLASAEVEVLRRGFDVLGLPAEHGFYASANQPDRAVAARVDEAVRRVAGPRLEAALPGLRPFLGSYLSKGAGNGPTISFHQDLTYTDERTDRATIVWIALDDVDAASGALHVVTGSHRWTTGCRPGGADELPTEAHQDAFAALAQPVPLPAGHAVFYDAGLVHGSKATDGPRPRTAVGVALAPAPAPLLHVHWLDRQPVAFQVDARYYAEQGLLNPPVGYPRTACWAPPTPAEDFVPHLAGVRA